MTASNSSTFFKGLLLTSNERWEGEHPSRSIDRKDLSVSDVTNLLNFGVISGFKCVFKDSLSANIASDMIFPRYIDVVAFQLSSQIAIPSSFSCSFMLPHLLPVKSPRPALTSRH